MWQPVNPDVDAALVVTETASWRGAARDRARAADWSLEGIEETYRRHAPRFRRVASAIVRDAATAEDVVHDAFARAVARRRSLRRSDAEIGWIWRIVVNSALSRSRRMQVEARALERVGAEAPPEQTPADERVRDCVARLPERQKLALFLRYYADLDYDTIAAALAIAPGTVGKLLHDARASVGDALAGERDG